MNRVLSPTPLWAKVQRVHSLPKDGRNTWLRRTHQCHWRGWQSVSCNSVWQHEQREELFGCRPLHGRCQGLGVGTLLHSLSTVWVLMFHHPLSDSECAVKWSIKYPFMSCSSLTLFAADGQKLSIILANLLSSAMLLYTTGVFWVHLSRSLAFTDPFYRHQFMVNELTVKCQPFLQSSSKETDKAWVYERSWIKNYSGWLHSSYALEGYANRIHCWCYG